MARSVSASGKSSPRITIGPSASLKRRGRPASARVASASISAFDGGIRVIGEPFTAASVELRQEAAHFLDGDRRNGGRNGGKADRRGAADGAARAARMERSRGPRRYPQEFSLQRFLRGLGLPVAHRACRGKNGSPPR